MIGHNQRIVSIIDAVKELMAKKKDKKDICSYKIRTYKNHRTITLDCKNCELGEASITDAECRKNIFRILISEPLVERLILSHLYERDYEREHLKFLYMLANFIDGIQVYKNAEFGRDAIGIPLNGKNGYCRLSI